MQRFNYHTHTYRCGHADNNMSDEDFVKLFVKKGFNKIAFTDHCPEKEIIDNRKNMRMKYSEKDEYLSSVKELKEKYKDILILKQENTKQRLLTKTNNYNNQCKFWRNI